MVATGRVEVATIGPTRTEKDFAAHVERTIDTDRDAGWVWVIDQLKSFPCISRKSTPTSGSPGAAWAF